MNRLLARAAFVALWVLVLLVLWLVRIHTDKAIFGTHNPRILALLGEVLGIMVLIGGGIAAAVGLIAVFIWLYDKGWR